MPYGVGFGCIAGSKQVNTAKFRIFILAYLVYLYSKMIFVLKIYFCTGINIFELE